MTDQSTYESVASDPGTLEPSQRRFWTFGRPPWTGSPCRVRGIPLGIRLAYALDALLGMLLAGWVLVEDYRPWGSDSQLLFGLLLTVAAILAASGICRLAVLRHACTGIGLWLAVSPCVLPRPINCVDLVLGLAAFLISGAAAEAVVAQMEGGTDE